MPCEFRESKGQMTVYGMGGVRHVVHRESRCQDCRLIRLANILELIFYSRQGLFYGYRIQKGGMKLYEQDALRNKSLGETFWFFIYRSITLIISVISNQTAFDVDFCFRMVMSTYHHAATFEGLADEFNDLHCKGVLF